MSERFGDSDGHRDVEKRVDQMVLFVTWVMAIVSSRILSRPFFTRGDLW
jgi:hypothetical protein